MTLDEWIEKNRLVVESTDFDNVYSIEGCGRFMLIVPKDGIILDETFTIRLSKAERDFILKQKIENILYSFGNVYYYTEVNFPKLIEEKVIKPNFTDFKYLGKVRQELDIEFSHLGVHSEYELMNGSHICEDWVKKAVFLGCKTLGICDENTLAGVLSFQMACKDEDIKSIIGETVNILYDKSTENEKFKIKLYVKNKEGWKNLLRLNKLTNVDNDGFVREDELLKHTKGLILVFCQDSIINKKDVNFCMKYIKLYAKYFEKIYYQIDSVKYESEEYDKQHLQSISRYLTTLSDVLEPVLINDSYYLDAEEHVMKKGLNKIDKTAKPHSEDEHFKCLDEVLLNINDLFNPEKTYKNGDNYEKLLGRMLDNANSIAEECNFKIDTGKHKLPRFKHDGDHLDLFFSLLQKGLEDKIVGKVKDQDIYMQRLEEETNVIVNAGFVDYFLILWDIVAWAKKNDILVGNARGSVAGSLVAYLLDITTVDSIKHDLLFERFLNKTRVSGERAKAADALPDVDIDFQGFRRDDVKRYIEEKYGKDYVCSIGAYTRMKLKGVIKDFARIKDLNFSYVNYITKKNIDNQIDYEWADLFRMAVERKDLKEFIQKNPDFINTIKFALNQVRTASVHASAVVIVPDTDEDGNPMDIYDWIPVRKVIEKKQEVLVSEWEGKYMDRAGFLKEDILGISQLDKFKMMLDLIKKNRGKKIVLEDVPLNDKAVYKLFQKGHNEEVFQLGTAGLKKYSIDVKPDSIEDLIAMNALYRPGPMGSNAHTDYADIKHGRKNPEFDYGLREVTKKTQGLYIYQEQIMKAVHVLGGLSLSEADEVRTIMKKFDKEKMATFENKFIQGAIRNGCKAPEAKAIWNKLERFSGYGFNRSHSAAYSIMGYWCQWIKQHYPLEFYTVCLNFANGELDVSNLINEFFKRELDMKINTPNVNVSNSKFVCDPNRNAVYWSLMKIKGMGVATVGALIKVRKDGGKFTNLENFIIRCRGNGVKKNNIEQLILSGAFDELEHIKLARDRKKLLIRMYKFIKENMPDVWNHGKFNDSHNWILVQRELIGYGFLDFGKILARKNPRLHRIYMTSDEFLAGDNHQRTCISGRIVSLVEADSKRGKYARMRMLSNNDMIQCIIWSDVWEKQKPMLEKIKKEGLLFAISGKIKDDDYWHTNTLYSDAFVTQVIPF